MNKQRRWNINKQFLTLTVLPILGLGLIIVIVGYSAFSEALTHQVNNELENLGNSVLTYFDMTYPGDYALRPGTTADGQTTYDLIKGDAVITQDYEYLDRVKASSGIDITLFYQDTRVLTTILTASGQRYIGTSAHPMIIEDVLENGRAHFYPKMLVGTTPFFAYYAPIYNSNHEIIGMIFAGKPSREVQRTVSHSLVPIVLIAFAACFLTALISISRSRKLVYAIQRVNRFLTKVTQGDLTSTLDHQTLSRADELGDMAQSAVNMQHSLRALIEQDVLTGLNNRRYGESKLQQLLAQNHSKSNNFTIAIGDIDLFKRVNDTYGHEAGDVILKGVSAQIKKTMDGKGYAARWGGEEFLFVFESIGYRDSVKALNEFLDGLRNTTFTYREFSIQVTMTIGVSVCRSNDNLNILLKDADDKLYKGKTEGRNRIVT